MEEFFFVIMSSMCEDLLIIHSLVHYSRGYGNDDCYLRSVDE